MLSVIVPVHNEEANIAGVVRALTQELSAYGGGYEILVVDDGSTDGSSAAATDAGAKVLRHASCHGYGQAIRTGIAAAQYERLAIIDGDGSYTAKDLVRLLEYVGAYDMVVGARRGAVYTGRFLKHLGRWGLKALCEFATGNTVKDVNSGLRIFRKSQVRRFVPELAYGFSFTTSLTLCMMLNGYFVGYVDVGYERRGGRSKVHHVRDTLRTFQLVCEAIARYNPIKLVLLIVALPVVFSLLSLVLYGLDCGAAFTWLILNLLVFTVSIMASITCIAVALVSRADKILAPDAGETNGTSAES